ncbi:MAG: Uma2 family endonuclease [Elainellaceae cyanobacterium]
MIQASDPANQTISVALPRFIGLLVTDDQFNALAEANRDLRLERTAQGELIVNPPTGGETGKQNWRISGELYLWWRGAGEPGKGFDSSTGFKLPNGAIRSPDAAWISDDRWHRLTEKQQSGIVPLCPDFVVELRSTSDSRSILQDKMQEYIDNGAQLGWLIDPLNRRVDIYRLDLSVESLDHPSQLSGEAILPGFILELQQIWE